MTHATSEAVAPPEAPSSAELREKRKQDSAALKEMLRPGQRMITTAQILSAVSAVLSIMPYVALVRIGELLLTSDGSLDEEAVRRWLFVLVGTFGGRLMVYFVALSLTHVADITVGNHIRSAMVDRIARAPLAWFTRTTSGAVRKSLQDDIQTVHTLIAHQPVESVSAVVTPIALMVYAFIVDWRLGLLSIAVLPLYAAAMVWMMRDMSTKTVEMDQKLGKISSTMVEFVTGITVVKAFGRVGRAHRNYQRAADEFYDFYWAWVRPMITSSSLGNSLLSIPLILLINIGGGAWMVHQGWVNAADVLATALIALVIPHSLQVVSNSTWSYQIASAAAARLRDMTRLDVLDDQGSRTPDSHDVAFDQVSYSYGEHLAADQVSFRLEAGTVTALVGASGSGKSTIATLLARFDDPDQGAITIGGVPLPEIKDLYQTVGFVLQDPQLLEISIADNIALGRPGATREEIREAARNACVLDEIEALPKGFDTIYGAGSGLSGGQAQRVAIARTLLIDAPVLILDEATALADPESQARIQVALSRLARGRTVLVIAHRPESIAGVDQIILLEKGRVVATGDHTQMLDQQHYRSLWESAEVRGQ